MASKCRFAVLYGTVLPFFLVSGSVSASDSIPEHGDWYRSANEFSITAESARSGAVVIGGQAWMGVYALRHARGMPATEEYASLSPAETDYLWSRRDHREQASGAASVNTRLDVAIKANPHVSLNIALRLDDAWNSETGMGPDHLLEAAYFEWRRLGDQSLSVRAGKQTMPFGMRRDEWLLSPYMAGIGQTGHRGRMQTTPDDASVYFMSALDRRYGVVLDWKPAWTRDLLSVEAGLFQDTGGRTLGSRNRSLDDMALRTFSTRLSFEPFEKTSLSASFMQRGNSKTGMEPYHRAWSVAARAPLVVVPLAVFAEFQRSWHDEFNPGRCSTDWHGGVEWAFHPDWRAVAQAERLVTRRPAGAVSPSHTGRERNRFDRLHFSFERDMGRSLCLEAGWQREWQKRRGHHMSPAGATAGTNFARLDTRSDTFYFGAKFHF